MLNKIFIMGRLTRDPELRRTQNGIAVTSFSLAVDRDYKTQSGERETDFIDVVAWRSTAEFVSKYFTKGRMAVVEGRLQIRDWVDKDNNKRRSAEVVADSVYFGDSKRDNNSSGGSDFRRAEDFGTPPPTYGSGSSYSGGSSSYSGGSSGYSGGSSSYSSGSSGYGGGQADGYDEMSEISKEDGELPF